MEDKKMDIFEFKELLEKEIVQYAICVAIFTGEYQRKYLKKISDHSVKLCDICNRLGEVNMLDDCPDGEYLMDKIVEDFIPDFGVPNFIYRNESGQEKIEKVMFFYSFKNLQFIQLVDGTVVEILENVMDKKSLKIVKKDGEEQLLSYDKFITPFIKSEIIKIIEENQ